MNEHRTTSGLNPHWAEPARVIPLAGDASNRRYWRLVAHDGSTAIRAEYPAGSWDRLKRDLTMLRWFATQGLRVPEILWTGDEPPTVILEDFGPDDAEAVLRGTGPADRVSLVQRLVEPLARLAAIAPGDLPPLNAPLDENRLRAELAGFETWYVSAFRGLPVSDALRTWLDALAHVVGHHPRRVCHRDYHLNNLYLLARGGIGMIDVQDALLGPDTYDLASLIGERAFPDLFEEPERRRLVQLWAVETHAEPGWESRLGETLVQRGLKVLGTFSRLEASGKSGYARWIEPLARRLVGQVRIADAPHELVDCLLPRVSNSGG